MSVIKAAKYSPTVTTMILRLSEEEDVNILYKDNLKIASSWSSGGEKDNILAHSGGMPYEGFNRGYHKAIDIEEQDYMKMDITAKFHNSTPWHQAGILASIGALESDHCTYTDFMDRSLMQYPHFSTTGIHVCTDDHIISVIPFSEGFSVFPALNLTTADIQGKDNKTGDLYRLDPGVEYDTTWYKSFNNRDDEDWEIGATFFIKVESVAPHAGKYLPASIGVVDKKRFEIRFKFSPLGSGNQLIAECWSTTNKIFETQLDKYPYNPSNTGAGNTSYPPTEVLVSIHAMKKDKVIYLYYNAQLIGTIPIGELSAPVGIDADKDYLEVTKDILGWISIDNSFPSLESYTKTKSYEISISLLTGSFKYGYNMGIPMNDKIFEDADSSGYFIGTSVVKLYSDSRIDKTYTFDVKIPENSVTISCGEEVLSTFSYNSFPGFQKDINKQRTYKLK